MPASQEVCFASSLSLVSISSATSREMTKGDGRWELLWICFFFEHGLEKILKLKEGT